jgi:hypothetical protein
VGTPFQLRRYYISDQTDGIYGKRDSLSPKPLHKLLAFLSSPIVFTKEEEGGIG